MNKDEIGEMYHDVDDCLTDEEEEEGFENQLDDDNEENLSGSYSAGGTAFCKLLHFSFIIINSILTSKLQHPVTQWHMVQQGKENWSPRSMI